MPRATSAPPAAEIREEPSIRTTRQLASVRAVARLLDDIFTIPGTRIRVGFDPILGLVPGLGDAIGGLLSVYIIVAAARLGAPSDVLMRMLGNVLVDSAVGSVPLVGDLFDVGWRANRRNVMLLEQHIAAPEKVRAASVTIAATLVVLLVLVSIGAVAVGVLVLRWLGRVLGA
ncbi:MAG TPA: DUF4112 domain-containing protein [Gemmatimonadaceae bacterium]|nr:DUF4112 domain-containing protein [Gemmatimonadaceae bacterium]